MKKALQSGLLTGLFLTSTLFVNSVQAETITECQWFYIESINYWYEYCWTVEV